MPTNLRTGWTKIGRTGKTVDNREITVEMVKDAVELYDPKQYKAFVWPEHARWYKMGGVEALRLVKNDEGGLDIEAILSPNDYWLFANAADQKTCTSMELDQLDRFGKRWYLIGLGATDSPASFGTTEIRFSKGNSETAVRGAPMEFALDAKPETPSFFARLFGTTPQPEDIDVDMKEFTQQFTALVADVKAMHADFAALKASAQAAAEPGVKADGADFKALETKVAEFGTQLAGLSTKLAALDGVAEKLAKLDEATTQLAALKADHDALKAEFNKAVSTPAAGTTFTKENLGEGDDLKNYI